MNIIPPCRLLPKLLLNWKHGLGRPSVTFEYQQHCRFSWWPKQSDNRYVVKGPPLDPVIGITAHEFLMEKLSTFKDVQLFSCGLTKKFYTAKDIIDMSRAFAAALMHYGLKKGDVVGIVLPNTPEHPIICLGIWLAGGVVAPISVTSTPDEFLRAYTLAECKMIVTMGSLVETMKNMAPQVPSLKSIIALDEFSKHRKGICDPCDGMCHPFRFAEMIRHSAVGVKFFTSADIDTLHDTAVLPFSSGTTGPPKAVMITHSNLCTNFSQYLQPGAGIKNMGITERYLGLLPFHHCFGFCALLFCPLGSGCQVCILPKFAPEAFLASLRNFKPTVLHLVPPLVQFLAMSPTIGKEDLKSVHTIICGAAPTGENLIYAMRQKAGKNLFFQEGFGMTEVTCVSHACLETMKENKMGSIGQLLAGTQAKIMDLEKKQSLPMNEHGELWIKGPQMMKGYLKNDKATNETLTPDGWLRTGDVAKYDSDKCFFIVGRLKELIKVKGLQVSPSELEDVLRGHPLIKDIAIVGVPHDKFGEAPKGFVVRKDGDSSLTADDVHKFLNKKVAKHKQLAGGIEFMEEIPKAPSGKILRRLLK